MNWYGMALGFLSVYILLSLTASFFLIPWASDIESNVPAGDIEEEIVELEAKLDRWRDGLSAEIYVNEMGQAFVVARRFTHRNLNLLLANFVPMAVLVLLLFPAISTRWGQLAFVAMLTVTMALLITASWAFGYFNPRAQYLTICLYAFDSLSAEAESRHPETEVVARRSKKKTLLKQRGITERTVARLIREAPTLVGRDQLQRMMPRLFVRRVGAADRIGRDLELEFMKLRASGVASDEDALARIARLLAAMVSLGMGSSGIRGDEQDADLAEHVFRSERIKRKGVFASIYVILLGVPIGIWLVTYLVGHDLGWFVLAAKYGSLGLPIGLYLARAWKKFKHGSSDYAKDVEEMLKFSSARRD